MCPSNDSRLIDAMMEYFPLFFDMNSTPVLVFGQGEDALRKIRLLLRSEAFVHVVSSGQPEWPEDIVDRVVIVSPDTVEDILPDMAFVIIAEESAFRRLNALERAKTAGKPVNVVDHKGLSDFIIPSISAHGKFVAAFTSSGAAPVIARDIRAQVERALPKGLEEFMQTAAGARAAVQISYPEAKQRRAFWERVSQTYLGSSREFSPGEIIKNAFAHESIPTSGQLHIVRIPISGSADELTLGDFRKLQSCDVAYIEADIGTEFTDLIRRDAERVRVTSTELEQLPERIKQAPNTLTAVCLLNA